MATALIGIRFGGLVSLLHSRASNDSQAFGAKQEGCSGFVGEKNEPVPHQLESLRGSIMKIDLVKRSGIAVLLVVSCVFISSQLQAQFTPIPTAGVLSIPDAQWLKPEALHHLQQIKGAERPLVLQVGSHMLFAQAHIPGSEYVGSGSQPAGIQQLENRASPLPRKKFIVLYCGCCPLNRCPNLGPAFAKLREMGFTNVKVLYLADNFGTDWADKGFPVEKGN